MDFEANKTPVEIFILVVIVNGAESHGKILMVGFSAILDTG